MTAKRSTFRLFLVFSLATHLLLIFAMSRSEAVNEREALFIPLGISADIRESSENANDSEPVSRIDPDKELGIEQGKNIENPDYQGLTKRYLELVREKIEENKFYPAFTRHTGMIGNVLIGFKIDRRGEFKDILIQRSSGSKAIDRTGLNAVNHMKKRIRRPAWSGTQDLKVSIVIKYQNTL